MAENETLTSTGTEANLDEAILAQEKRIEQEIAQTTPLVGIKEDLSTLQKEYAEEDDIYQQKIKDLRSRYNYIRRTRRDGNCFFRAFGYAYLEHLLDNKAELNRFKTIALQSKDDLIELGFPKFTLEDFYDVFMEVLDKVERQVPLEDLLATFNDQGYSDYMVVYLRLLTSGHLQKESEFYDNFIEGTRTIKEFCSQEVEPMYKESDHIHIIALTSTLNVGVRVIYMDRGEGGSVNVHDFPEGSEPQVHVLYRPGHYDILYV